MKTINLAVVFMLVVSGASVRADQPEVAAAGPETSRGFLSGLGLSLVGLGVAGAVVGVSGVLIGSDARKTLALYAPQGVATQSEASTALDVDKRRATGDALALAGFIGAGVLLAGGITLFLLDAPRAGRVPVALTIVPTREGAMMSAALAF